MISLLVLSVSWPPDHPQGNPQIVEQTPGLVAFWTFGEPAGSPRLSQGTPSPHPLAEVGGPIARVEGGPYSGYSAYLDGKQYFSIPHAELGDLNIAGPEAQVSMFAVVKIDDLNKSRTIAGVWSEGKGANDDTGTRQYALLMHMPTYGGTRNLTPHISSEGGVTRRADGSAFPWCCDYAATRVEVPEDQWCTLAFTYDGQYIRAYINGTFEPRNLDPVNDKRDDPYFTTEGPNGARPRHEPLLPRAWHLQVRPQATRRHQDRPLRLHRGRPLRRGQDAGRSHPRPLRRPGRLQPRPLRRRDQSPARLRPSRSTSTNQHTRYSETAPATS